MQNDTLWTSELSPKDVVLPTNFKIQFKNESYTAKFITNTKDAVQAFKLLLRSSARVFACDLETACLPQYKHIEEAALSPHMACIRLMTVFEGNIAYCFDFFKFDNEKIRPFLQTFMETKRTCFHGAVFDYKMLYHWFKVREVDMHCTRIMATAVFQAVYFEFKKADLKSISWTLLQYRMNKDAGKTDWSKPLTFEQVVYALRDSIAGYKVYKKLVKHVKDLKQDKVYKLNKLAQLPLAEMEYNGIGFNKKDHQENVAIWRKDLVKAASVISKITKIAHVTPAKMGKWLDTNLDKDTKAIWPKTPTGKFKTDVDTFVDFDFLAVVKPFAEFQKLKTLTSRSGRNVIEHINLATKRIHPSFKVFGAATGRLSCSNPNVQQATRKDEFRKCFIPAEGMTFVIGDYSQIEVRIMAEYAREEKMLRAFELGYDIYEAVAAEMLHKDIKAVTSEERKKMKPLVLGLQYGLGINKYNHYAKKQYGVVLKEGEGADQVYKYKRIYHKVTRWQEKQVEICPTKRFRCFTKLGKARKLTEETFYGACMNMPIQGTAAEVQQLALVYMWRERNFTDPLLFKFIATIHDEIIVECLAENIIKVQKLMKRCMEKAYIEIMGKDVRTLRNLVNPKSGNSWFDAK